VPKSTQKGDGFSRWGTFFYAVPVTYPKRTVPQRLKPFPLAAFFGTAKPVPFRQRVVQVFC
jgi:hypothetical protein